MRSFTPEISWHNRLPALALDISPEIEREHGRQYRVATGGNDCRVYIWLVDLNTNKQKEKSDETKHNNQHPKLTTNSKQPPEIRIRAGLRRHQKSVGAVRFSSQNHFLASGDDDGYIYIWHHKYEDDQDLQVLSVESNAFLNDDGFEDLEIWKQQRVLRGHIEDICDLTWSKDSQFLLSGSVDNSAILWDITKGTKVWCSDLIKGYVQGVALDPHSQYMAALSSDRTLRLYNFNDKRQINATRRMNIKNQYKAFFSDDTVQTFCRRFEFSPDGQFLLAPTCRLVEKEPKPEASETTEATGTKIEVIDIDVSRDVPGGDDDNNPKVENDPSPSQKKKPLNALLVFKRGSFNKPVHYYPTGKEVALCVRFSPVVYKLKEREDEANFWGIPYRLVFAIATSRSVLIYDSQHSAPIGYASQIHLARLTDLAWSSDGRLLMVTSYDGYSTLLTFEPNEFGEIYTDQLFDPLSKPEEIQIEADEEQQVGATSEDCLPPPKKVATEDDTKPIKKATPKKITPVKLPESATLFKYFSKKS